MGVSKAVAGEPLVPLITLTAANITSLTGLRFERVYTHLPPPRWSQYYNHRHLAAMIYVLPEVCV